MQHPNLSVHSTIIDTISDLQGRGFFSDFSLIGSKLLCVQQKLFLKMEEFDILEMYHFAWDEYADKGVVIYAISCPDRALKGILLSSLYEKAIRIPSVIQKKIQKFWV